jgi:large subunit ribosomal protein L18
MKKKIKKLYLQNKKRYLKKIVGTLAKPRLSVFKSHKHIYAQLIDDKLGKTLVFTSTVAKEFKNFFIENKISTSTQKVSFLIGQNLAEKAKQKEIKFAVFDRGNFKYHGRIKSLAEGAREKGLNF